MNRTPLRASRLVAAVVGMMLTLPTISRAQTWVGELLGSSEVPPNASSATGFMTVSLSGNFLSVVMNWNGLTVAPSAAHIHCCTSAPATNVGVAIGLPGLPAATSGTYNNLFDLTLASTYSAGFVTNFGGGTASGAQVALINGLNSRNAYGNIHNSVFPGGEIRSNLVVTPEPSSVVLLALGMVGVGAVAMRRRRVAKLKGR